MLVLPLQNINMVEEFHNMAQDMMSSLFGPSPEQLRQQRMEQDQILSQNAARISPYYGAGYGIGNAIGSVASALFGLEDADIKRARTMQGVLTQAASDLPEADRADSGKVLNRVSQLLAEVPGFERESMLAAMQGNQITQANNLAAAQLDSLTTGTSINISRENRAEEQFDIDKQISGYTLDAAKVNNQRSELLLKNEQATKVADIASGALQNINDNPNSASEVFMSTINNLRQYNKDIPDDATLVQLPLDQKKNLLKSIVNSSTTNAQRTAQQQVAFDNALKIRNADETARHNRTQEAYQTRLSQLEEEKLKLTGRSLELKLTEEQKLLEAMKKDQLNQAWKGQSSLMMDPKNKVQVRSEAAYLKDYLSVNEIDLDDTEVAKYTPEYIGLVNDYLNRKDKDSLPLYSGDQARNLASQEMASRFKTKTKWGMDSLEYTRPEAEEVKPDPLGQRQGI
jgi:hypothetical protein